MSILERGGNAADAAAAGGFVLQVVEPHLNGPGGEVPILVWSEVDSRASVICGQGVAASAATVQSVADLGLDLMPGTGLLPAVVPGAFGAWTLLVEQYGTMTLREVLEPAIHYLDQGHPFLPSAAAALVGVRDLFELEWKSSAATWLPRGRPVAEWENCTNPVMAETYRRVLVEAEAGGGSRERQFERARECWYRGFVAEAIHDFCQNTAVMDSSGERHAGQLTGEDLAGWSPTIEAPTSLDYRNCTVLKTGPWGQGPVMLQQLALLEGFDLEGMGAGSAEWVHTILESSKLAYADREAWYGDPNFADIPLNDLLGEQYNSERRQLIAQDASLELRPGSPGGRRPHLPRFRTTASTEDLVGLGEPTVAHVPGSHGDTCHMDVVDRSGMMISATPSGGWFQASPTVPHLGFCLSVRGQMFVLEEGHPNALRPKARPRTTLTPSFALRDGKPWMAFGTPGGDSQDQWSLQLFLNVVEGGMNLQEAIDAPAFHSTHMPSSFYPRDSHPGEVHMEDRFPASVIEELQHRGHRVVHAPSWSEGRLSAVAREGGWFKAAANPRGNQGYAVGR